MTRKPLSPAPAAAGAGATAVAEETELRGERWRGLGPRVRRYGVIGTFLLAFAVFAILKPDEFLSWDNFSNILSSSAVPAIVACGITVPLIMNDFDLSIGGVLAFVGSVVVVLQATNEWNYEMAMLVGLLVAVGIGLLNGLLIARLGGSSFVITLALGSVYSGLVLWVTNSQTIYSGLKPGFLSFGQDSLLGIRLPIIYAIVIAIGLFLLTERTVLGRKFYAVGENATAAYLTGMPVERLRTYGLVLSALAAGFGGMVLFAQAGATYANAGSPFLLAGFSAAFLGAALRRNGRFSVLGSAISVVLVQAVATGLVIVALPAWTINVFEGSILAVAILLAPQVRIWK
ncbi:MAG TPA: ABC transporter permease [Solirubrobacterales bacterium]|nr:ABC transporter permease [Solirubrobacterales bacterium]